HGRNENGTGEAVWVVKECGEIEFEGEVRDKVSERTSIDLTKLNVVGKCVDINDDPYEGVPFKVVVDDKVVYEGESDSNGQLFAPVEEDQDYDVLFF
ncbi:hypothetical protein QA601_16250, partial [Chitinispirillales bacterium ANBcel5]|uniref:hypothetical protein n=1 Tax=Cellulosispirillum alkaliphilum TaxID=3039283 RepID=UPI002A4E38F5|nr:hypothetical protein [Chitinispirillales bacterium ANBcel5]